MALETGHAELWVSMRPGAQLSGLADVNTVSCSPLSLPLLPALGIAAILASPTMTVRRVYSQAWKIPELTAVSTLLRERTGPAAVVRATA